VYKAISGELQKKEAEKSDPVDLPQPGHWAVVELMGHVRMAGWVSEQERFGSKLGRIEIPNDEGSYVTQWFGGGSVYRLTACDEATARAVAHLSAPSRFMPGRN
jgi:hypothetical protein